MKSVCKSYVQCQKLIRDLEWKESVPITNRLIELLKCDWSILFVRDLGSISSIVNTRLRIFVFCALFKYILKNQFSIYAICKKIIPIVILFYIYITLNININFFIISLKYTWKINQKLSEQCLSCYTMHRCFLIDYRRLYFQYLTISDWWKIYWATKYEYFFFIISLEK